MARTTLALCWVWSCMFGVQTEQRAKWGEWQPQTEGWRKVLEKREQQIHRMPVLSDRLDALISLAHQGGLIPNFTTLGFSHVLQPAGVYERLAAVLQRKGALPWQEEGAEGRIVSGKNTLFIPVGALGDQLLVELLDAHEAWAGVKLEPSTAYGLRVYQPGNELGMHLDHFDTHIISSILHVGEDVDEPWPLAIEGFDGQTAEVQLRPGEMLFYESAKSYHGRLRTLKGRWYAALFMHYRPAGWSKPFFTSLLGKPSLDGVPEDGQFPQFRRVRHDWNAVYEPGCPHGWCNLAVVGAEKLTSGSSQSMAKGSENKSGGDIATRASHDDAAAPFRVEPVKQKAEAELDAFDELDDL